MLTDTKILRLNTLTKDVIKYQIFLPNRQIKVSVKYKKLPQTEKHFKPNNGFVPSSKLHDKITTMLE